MPQQCLLRVHALFHPHHHACNRMHLNALQARLVCAACLHLSTSVPQLPCSRSRLYKSCSCFAITDSMCLDSPCMVIPSIDAGTMFKGPCGPGSAA